MRHLIPALALLLLAGCPDPLDGCEWGASEVGPYQQHIDEDAGVCLASTVDTNDRIVVSGPLDIVIHGATTVGSRLDMETRLGRVAILTDAHNGTPGLVCFYTPGEDGEESCDSVRLACDTHDGLEPGAIERPSTFIRFLVDGEEVDYVQIVAESFAIRSGL